jgi:hypothetical protein
MMELVAVGLIGGIISVVALIFWGFSRLIK